MFTKDPQFWQAMRNTLWIIAVGLPLEIAFAMLTAMLLTRPRRGHRVYRTVYFLPTLAPAGGGRARVRVHPQPVVRAREPDPEGARRRPPAALVLRPVDLEVGPRVPRPVGRGADDDHLPRGPPRRPGAPVRGRRHRGRGPVAEVPVRDAADDVAGHLLLARDRRDLRLPVLHPGVRRELRRRGFGAELGRRQRRLAAGVAAVLLALPVREGLRELPDGLRIGDGVGAVPDHDGLHRDPDQDVATLGALPGRASDSHDPRPAGRTADRGGGRPAPDPAAGAASAVPHVRGQPRRDDRRGHDLPAPRGLHRPDGADDGPAGPRARTCGRTRSAGRTSPRSSTRSRCSRTRGTRS